MDQKVRPVRDSHSIKSATINVYLVAPILNAQRFQRLIEGKLKEKYHQFEPISSIEIKFKGTGPNIHKSNANVLRDVGFKFSAFEKGVVQKVLQGINNEKRYILSFQIFDYISWSKFFGECIESFGSLLEVQPEFFVSGYGLQYIDEFIWIEKDSKLDKKLIFNENSDFLPKAFFNPNRTTYTLVREDDINLSPNHELLQIKTENRIKDIVSIHHQYTKPLNQIIDLRDLIGSNVFRDELSAAHSRNVELLRNLLTKELSEMIHLPKN